MNQNTLNFLASIAYRELFRSGGFSIHPSKIVPKYGYFVSVPGHEIVENVEFVDVEFVRDYFKFHPLRGNLYWGGWIDGNNVYLDLSAWFENRTDAAEAADRNKQLAYYSIREERSFTTDYRPDSSYAGIQSWSRSDHYPWVIYWIDREVHAIHPDGSERGPFASYNDCILSILGESNA